jgi:hypothetical protein
VASSRATIEYVTAFLQRLADILAGRRRFESATIEPLSADRNVGVTEPMRARHNTHTEHHTSATDSSTDRHVGVRSTRSVATESVDE